MIGCKLDPALLEAVERGFDDTVWDRRGPKANDGLSGAGTFEWTQTFGVQYELSLYGYDDERAATRIREAVCDLVNEIASIMPLGRLDGITIGADYSGLLLAVERGWEGAPSPNTAPEEIGVGVAQVVMVRRSGTVKGRIVISDIISEAFISGDEGRKAWAKYVVAKQVASVGLMEIIEARLPGTLLKALGGGIDGWLYASADGAPESYTASSIASAFGDSEEVGGLLRECLVRAVDRMMETVPRERLAYREHGDLERLLEIARPAIWRILIATADFLGHCAFTRTNPLGDAPMLNDALDRAGLRDWLGVYFEDLASFHLRLGKWETFDEFLAFNIHVERLLLAVGMFAWEAPEGLRIEVPLGTDSQALLARLQN